MPGKLLQLGRRWRRLSAAAVIAVTLPACSDATMHDPEPPTPTCPPSAQQTTYAFDCYTLAELQRIADATARDGGQVQADADAGSGAAGAESDAGANTTGPLVLSCPSPDPSIYPPLSGFLDTPPPGHLAESRPGECCYYRTVSFCAGL
jgi:hypothetical protein